MPRTPSLPDRGLKMPKYCILNRFAILTGATTALCDPWPRTRHGHSALPDWGLEIPKHNIFKGFVILTDATILPGRARIGGWVPDHQGEGAGGGKRRGADGAGVSRVSAMGEPEHENHVNYGVFPICLTLLAAGWISQLWKGLALSCVDLRKPW